MNGWYCLQMSWLPSRININKLETELPSRKSSMKIEHKQIFQTVLTEIQNRNWRASYVFDAFDWIFTSYLFYSIVDVRAAATSKASAQRSRECQMRPTFHSVVKQKRTRQPSLSERPLPYQPGYHYNYLIPN